MSRDARRRYRKTCWLTPRAVVRPSPIQGLGLFAAEPIAAGEVVMRLGGKLIDDSALARLKPPYSSVAVAEDLNLLIDTAHPVRYGNHSCDPNLWPLDAATVAARRDIAVGEELTIDYATQTVVGWWSMRCTCAAPDCRKTIRGDDWRLPGLQAAYGDHWAEPALERINASV